MAVPAPYRDIVGTATWAAGAIGVPGAFAFGADIPVLIGIWTTGGVMIAERAGRAVSKDQVAKAATSAVAGAAALFAGSRLASFLFGFLPGPGTVAGIGLNSSLNAYYTYGFLRNVAKLYDAGDTEDYIWHSLSSVWTILLAPDIGDLIGCVSGRDPGLAAHFRN